MNGESSPYPSPSAFDRSLGTLVPAADSSGKPVKEALFWAPVLSLLFIIVYGACMWLTAVRADIGTCYFPIERWIPFVPAMIIPYWSLDLFFVGAPFLCRTRSELHMHVKRIFFVILVAGFCFLLFPLKLGFQRPQVSGFFGFFFNALRSFDLPYNLAPSLHIALRSVLWPIYTRHTQGWTNVLVKIWFVLIGLSTLLVWQHHLVDVLTGQMLAMLCLYLIPRWEFSEGERLESREELPPRKIALGACYALAAVVCAVLSSFILPWGLLLAWPSFGLGMMSAAYLQVGAAAFRKYQGKLSLSARLVLAPYLIGNYVCYLYYKRSIPPYSGLAPGVLIGRRIGSREATCLTEQGVTAVLDLTAEYSENSKLLALTYRNIQILDHTMPSLAQLQEAVDFIRKNSVNGKVYVHCGLGCSRVAAVAAAFLLASKRASHPGEAIEHVREARPAIVTEDSLQSLLQGYQGTLPVDG